ncbi:upstream activation factor subunit UAF30 isoform X1 [Eutrema salsugineum]|nr:upstream activation factor subunit UAF30 isoform X1 [Eutrema salsugineum]
MNFILFFSHNGSRIYTVDWILTYPLDFSLLRTKMLPQRLKKAVTDNPKKLGNLIDLVNLPSTLREFVGQSQISRLGCFMRVWSYIKTNNLQDPKNKNVVNCDDKLKSILLGKQRVELVELPSLIKLHFPKEPK